MTVKGPPMPSPRANPSHPSGRRRSRPWHRAAALASAIAAGTIAWELASWATPTLTLISPVMDGVTPDWSPVLFNGIQTSHDGDGKTIPCAYSTDRDCPVGGGTGNDLLTFAWTYDSSFIYLFTERYQAATTGVDFFYAADVNGDGRFDSGAISNDKLIHVGWTGNSGKVAIEACPYTAQPAVAWAAGIAYLVGTRVQPAPVNGWWYVAVVAGTSGAAQPAFCLG